MKLQILPNWCKKLGLLLFFVGSFLSGGDDFIDGWNGLPYRSEEGSKIFAMFFGLKAIHIFNVIGILALLIAMFSKEKIEDDFIDKLRLESYQLAAIFGLIISIILFSFSKDFILPLDDLITLFMFSYLIIFFIKKRIY